MKSPVVALVILCILACSCGTAPVTGRNQLFLVGEEEMEQLGAEAYQEILQANTLSSREQWVEAVKRVGARISQAANEYAPDFKWEYNVIADPQVNAFCLPGGKIAFYEGIFQVMRHEADIAVVMGHEVAHATNQHSRERMSAGAFQETAFDVVSTFLDGGENDGTAQQMVFAALGVGAQVGFMLPFSREHESEADEVGLHFMAEAGYDPSVAVSFWERFAALTEQAGAPPLEFLSTHPDPLKRSKRIQELLPEVMGIYEASPKLGVGEKLQ